MINYLWLVAALAMIVGITIIQEPLAHTDLQYQPSVLALRHIIENAATTARLMQNGNGIDDEEGVTVVIAPTAVGGVLVATYAGTPPTTSAQPTSRTSLPILLGNATTALTIAIRPSGVVETAATAYTPSKPVALAPCTTKPITTSTNRHILGILTLDCTNGSISGP